ncbi:MAG: hypothetical protein C4525_08545 [Desulfarculus sp.]|jgi:predicted N-acetyltransferase YhbS|nr:MAG: hypothetical protein C4525_08545 [Desulfarculus sp.]
MLKTQDLQQFKHLLESGAWADAFANAGEELRLEMIEKVELLLEAADLADRVVGEVLFSKDGMAPPAPAAASSLERD